MLLKLTAWFKNNFLLICTVLLASVIRFYNIDYQSVWLDEIHTLNEANPKLSFSELYATILMADPHPPLYFILMHVVFQIFGYTTFVLRAVSAIIGIASVIGIYHLGKEIFNRKTGQYAAILLAINYFHLTYSQEGRMYALLMLATIFSFYFLIKFIKQPSVRSAIVYTIFSTVMIYCHFFALFALVSQYIILLFFVVKPFRTTTKKFFFYCFASGVATLLLYLPTYTIFKKAAERDSIWIPMPTPDVYTQIFKDFFGQSEIVLFFIIILILLFFSNLFKEKGSEKLKVDPEKDKLIFVFLVIFIWIGITLLIPLIRTYTALPMLINRYFINIVPAVIIIVSIGLYYVRNEVVRYLILGLIIIFSLTDIIIVKKYYKEINKTQFRELSNFITKHNTIKEPVVSSLGWYFPYFLNNEKVNMNIIDKPLELYVNEMMLDSTKKHPFWYVDAHGRTLNISEPVRKYLDENFVIAHIAELYNGWTNHYALISEIIKEEDVSKYNLNNERSGDFFKYYIDLFETDSNRIKSKGWAYFEEQDATNSEITIVLVKDRKAYKMQSYTMLRGDVATYYKIPYNLDNCGFNLNVQANNLGPGKYQLGIILKNIKTAKEGLVLSNNFFTKL